MSTKKSGSKSTSKGSAKPAQSKSAPAKATPRNGANNRALLFVGIAVALAIVGIYLSSKTGKPITSTTPGGSGTSVASAPAEEQKYIGRFLPAGFAEAEVASATPINATRKMTPITATADAKGGLTVKVADVVSNGIVSFSYPKAGGSPIPMIAYVKPSGKLFVGVSYCVPCQGIGQRFETDGTLTCESCGTKRDPETGVGLSGACRLYPLDELPVTVSNGVIMIDKAALDGWTVQPQDRKVGA